MTLRLCDVALLLLLHIKGELRDRGHVAEGEHQHGQDKQQGLPQRGVGFSTYRNDSTFPASPKSQVVKMAPGSGTSLAVSPR